MKTSSRYRRPVIGVLVGRRLRKTNGMKELAKANQTAKTTLYFFSAEDVDFRTKTIKGIKYNFHENRWDTSIYPMPDVLYVRGGSYAEVLAAVKRFDKMGIPRINPVVRFNKGELFQKLIEDEEIRPYLPYTRTIGNFDRVREYMQSLGSVYIKACYGGRGTKVMNAFKSPEGGYEYSYSIYTDLVRERVRHFDNLRRVMSLFFRHREVIVQQAIDVIRVGRNQPVDFRAELQRNGEGKIEITGISVRVGQENSPITTHASAYRFDDKLKELLPGNSEQELEALKEHIERFLINVYRSVEKLYGKFGEIGIDFAVDNNQKIWLIECNAQSAKVSIAKAYDYSTITKVWLNPLEYAKTISKRSAASMIGKRS